MKQRLFAKVEARIIYATKRSPKKLIDCETNRHNIITIVGSESFEQQIAALPFRQRRGKVGVLLVTSRETKRWVIPKGWPMDGRTEYNAAKIEAFEEAGAEGRISTTAIGAFEYVKRLKDGACKLCRVAVYPLDVSGLARNWPEQDQRERRWFSAAEAAALVDEPQLKEIIGAL
jgi:8-oxo-dGTP pyrophosphatase MutT (NUDIX family)